MTIGSLTPLQPTLPKRECFSINDVRSLVSEQLGVDIEFVTSETHFANDLGADLIDRVELMLVQPSEIEGLILPLRREAFPCKSNGKAWPWFG